MGNLTSLRLSSGWVTFASDHHKQTMLLYLLITGKIYSTSLRETFKENPHIFHLLCLHLCEAFVEKNNRGSMQCNLDLCICKELISY